MDDWGFSIVWPPGALGFADTRQHFLNVLGSRIKRALETVKGWAAATTPFPHIAQAYQVVQESGAELSYSIINTDDDFWWVESDTQPHNIPGAFGRPAPFGEGGRFSGYFHPGTHGHHMFEQAWDQGTEQLDNAMGEGLASYLSLWGSYGAAE
jgi:hypothetical protein